MATEEKLEAYIATPEFARVLTEMPDSRDSAGPGDVVAALWFPDQNWYIGVLEDGEAGLGFVIDDISWGDLEGAHHAIVLAKAGTPRFE